MQAPGHKITDLDKSNAIRKVMDMPDILTDKWDVSICVDTSKAPGHAWIRYKRNGNEYTVGTIKKGWNGGKDVVDWCVDIGRKTSAERSVTLNGVYLYAKAVKWTFPYNVCTHYALAVWYDYTKETSSPLTWAWIHTPLHLEQAINIWNKK